MSALKKKNNNNKSLFKILASISTQPGTFKFTKLTKKDFKLKCFLRLSKKKKKWSQRQKKAERVTKNLIYLKF